MLTFSGEVLSSVSHSQDAIHERYGGVVPEVASRAHVERMTAVVREALRQAGCGVRDLGGVAATVGPGLIGALLVGVQTAKAIAWSRRLPFYPVNHLHGHLAAAWLSDPTAPFPMVTLLASGGHTMLVRVDDRTHLQAAGTDPGRCCRRGVRQGRPTARPWLSRGQRAGRTGRAGRPCRFLVSHRPAAFGPSGLLVLGREDRSLLPACEA